MVISLKINIQDIVLQGLTLEQEGIILNITCAYLGYFVES